MNKVQCMNIRMDANTRTAWNTLLQRGFYIEGPAGKSVREFIIATFQYEDDFINETVRTIFLNNSPVDDMDGIHVKEDDKLALASAMPGLVGIVMGRDNPFKSFRSDIACKRDEGGAWAEGSVRVFAKILSSLAVETGEAILGRGIEVTREHLFNLLEEKAEGIVEGPTAAELPEDDTFFVRVEFF